MLNPDNKSNQGLIPRHPSYQFLKDNILVQCQISQNMQIKLHESMMGTTFVEMIYSSKNTDGNAEARNRDVVYNINEWLLEVFPSYYSDITQGINDDGAGYIKITTVEPPKYRWKITRDRISTGVRDGYPEETDKGTTGPRGCDENLKTNPKRFSMYDDDDNCYYEGMIYGDYDGLEPLDDFGMPNAGCTYVKMGGEII